MILETIVGGVLGKGAALGKEWLSVKRDAAKFEHELEMSKLEIEATIQVAKTGVEVAESETEYKKHTADLNSLAKALESDRETYDGGIVDIVRGLVRPVLTAVYTGMLGYIAYQLDVLSTDQLMMSQVFELRSAIINQILFLASVSTTYYYGTRPNRKEKKK